MQPGGQGSAVNSSNEMGSGAEPQPKSNFVHFTPPPKKNLTSSGNDSIMIFLIINWPNLGQFKE